MPGGRVRAAAELVCIVDDDESVRRGLRRLLKSAGYTADTFSSAEEYLAREIFPGANCLLLDVRMPGLKGPALQEALEERRTCEQIVFRALQRAEEQLRRRGERQEARGRIEKLTPREFEVLRFVVRGLLNKQIAAELNTAEKTVKVHRGRVMQKLGVTSVADLVRISQRAGVSPARNRA
ncbi:MAG: DNA-binding response regulator [Verrucomicrobia bacterium]|nr:MAG: DNA-binding response regulator [Verrucomicrobiota bacterium]